MSAQPIACPSSERMPSMACNLIKQIKSLSIDTREKLEKILYLIFDEAISEPEFCEEYADLCKCLSSS